MSIMEKIHHSHIPSSSMVCPDVFSTAFSTSALEVRSNDSRSKISSDEHLSDQVGTDQFWRLDTDPVIPWPERLNGQTMVAFEFGGKGWEDLGTVDEEEKCLDKLSDWCLSQYREALYMPEMIYSLSCVLFTLQRFASTAASNTSIESSKNIISPLSALVRTIPDLSQKYKRTLPPLLPSLFNPSSNIAQEESGLGKNEWEALRIGLGLFLGSQGEKEKDCRRRKEKEKIVGEEGKEIDKIEEEEEREEKRRVECEKEERWIEKGKNWLERLEKRETLLQILVHFLLLPPASSLPPSHIQTEPPDSHSDSRSKLKKRSRTISKSSRLSSKKADPVFKSLDQLTDRLSVWQALDSLGVEELGSDEAERDRRRDLRKIKGDLEAKGKVIKEERDWIRVFWEDVVEKHFSQTHTHIMPLLRSKLNFPSITRIIPSRSKSILQPADHSTSSSSSNRSSSMALISGSPDSILARDGSTLSSGKSRTKPLARQLPSSANASVRLDFARSKSSRSSTPISLSSQTNPGSRSTQDSLFRRTQSSSHYALGPTRSASNIYLASPSSSVSTSFASRTGFARSGSTSSATGAASGSVSRANSVGPETKAEKLMRRSVSFSRGSSVGRKGSSDFESGTGGGYSDKVESNGKKKMERTSSVGGRTLMASTSFSSSTSLLPTRSAPPLSTSFSQGSFQSQSQPQTLVPATPTKPIPSASQSTHNLIQPSFQPAFAPDSPEFMGETPPRSVRSSGFLLESQHEQARFGGKGLFGVISTSAPNREEDEGGEGMMDLFVIGTDDEGDDQC